MEYSIGIGITNACNSNCSFCYVRKERIHYLSLETIKILCNKLNIHSINLGTGESGLHPQFKEIIAYLYEQEIRTGLTTNGYSVSLLNDEELKWFNDIDFSLDFPDKPSHDKSRGEGFYDLVMRGIERCQKIDIEASIVVCMMNVNFHLMDKMVALSKDLGVNLRINIYKTVNTSKYKLNYGQFWKGVALLLENAKIISCSEPIINAVIRNKVLNGGPPCGKRSLRIRPTADIVPCVYWNKSDVSIEDFFTKGDQVLKDSIEACKVRTIPIECKRCEFYQICQGGCAARRLYRNGLEKPDEYCFKLREDNVSIGYEWTKAKQLIHSDYLCTLIVEGK